MGKAKVIEQWVNALGKRVEIHSDDGYKRLCRVKNFVPEYERPHIGTAELTEVSIIMPGINGGLPRGPMDSGDQVFVPQPEDVIVKVFDD